ncbi:MAG TPA: Na+/H+ antiporter [Candidatus Acidoferrales bacterium]|nr:Na+/H+ antiporter [Candidatus Acidoferrales bacterium]
MNESLLFLILCAIVLFAVVAKRLRLAYPIVFVLGGVLLALIPGVPTVTLQPDWVFLLFLPPLLFGDGWSTDFKLFMRYRQPIGLLAVGLVGATTLTVMVVGHWVLRLPLGVSFVLGAILSPTDAVATDAIAEELSLPQRLGAILSGESLVNDATGLVLYRFGVAAVVAGSLAVWAPLDFVYVAVGGVVVGLVIANLLYRVQMFLNRQRLSDTLITVALTLAAPFLVYVPADDVGVSGVLAAVSAGMYLSHKSPAMFDSDTRIAANNVWNLLFFTLNGAAFILIGLQLRSLYIALAGFALGKLLVYGLVVTATVILTRFAWVFPVARLRRLLNPRIAEREGPAPPWTWTFILGWAGMRGIVSLAAALALPTTTMHGLPFPARQLLIFITFTVILVSLLVQGLSLPWLIRRLNVVEQFEPEGMVARARVEAADAALRKLTELETEFDSVAAWQVGGRLRAYYEQRLSHYRAHIDGVGLDEDARQHAIDRKLRHQTYAAERERLSALRRSGEISDDVYRRLEHELDLAESRLAG